MPAIHECTAIRNAVIAQLLNRTIAEDRVVADREVNWRENDLPALAVYIRDEDIDVYNPAPRKMRSKATLLVEGQVIAEPGTSLEDWIDRLSLEVRKAIVADDTLGGTADDVVITGRQTAKDDSGRQAIGMFRLAFEVTYYFDAPAAEDGSLDDLKTLRLETNLGAAQDAPERAIDLVEHLEQ